MSDRRTFIRYSLLSSLMLAIGKKVSAETKPNNKIIPAKTDFPIVISTWDFGQQANAAAWGVLKDGGKALDAVESGVKVPEADPENQSVGLGGRPDRDGKVTLDACIMDENCRIGSVAALENIVHAVSVARLVMEKTPHVMLVGDGAQSFALANGFKKENLLTSKSEQEWKEWLQQSKYQPVNNIENTKTKSTVTKSLYPGDANNHDTIGMLAMDKAGNLSGACTTSGMAYKMHGRVGDSPIIGAGLYVDNEIGAATSTGLGEEIIRVVGSHLVVELMRQGYHPELACKKALERIVAKNPQTAQNIQVGFLAINKKGEYGGYSLQKGFTYAVKSKNEDKIYNAKNIF